jgi:hypothetical protein
MKSKFNNLYQSITEMMPLQTSTNNPAAPQNTTVQPSPSAAQQPQPGQPQANSQPGQQPNQPNQQVVDNAQMQQIVQAVLQQLQKVSGR